MQLGLVVDRAVEDELGRQLAQPLELHRGGSLRDDHGGLEPERLGGIGDREAVVARRGRHDVRARLEPRQCRERAPYLERAGRLLGLELQQRVTRERRALDEAGRHQVRQ